MVATACRRFARTPALFVALLAFAAPSAQAFPGANGKLAFTSDRDGNNEIYSANADGSGPVNLTNDPGDDQSPAWSPDGKRIVFGSFRDGRQHLYLMNADGSGQARLSPDDSGSSDDASPSWSPDGTQVAFESTRPFGDSWAVWAMNSDGTGLHRLSASFGVAPAWSPDGTKIAYVGLDPTVDGASAIFVMDADGGNAHRVTGATVAEDQPAWSPDGTRLVFARFRSDWRTSNVHQLYVVNLDGSGERRLTDGEYYDGNPAWSPDGTKVLFQRHQGAPGQPELYVVNGDGSGLAPLVTGPGRNFTPDWAVAVSSPPPPPPGDTTPPRVFIGVPGYDDSYLVGQNVRADFSCRDDRDGPDALSVCEATLVTAAGQWRVFPGDALDTSSAGAKTLRVVAEDKAGNRTVESRTYHVVYDFSGFFSPVSNLPALNAVKAGEGVPVRFSLAGDQGLNVVADASAVEMPCDSTGLFAAGTAASGRLSYNRSLGRYTYLWQTEGAWARSCRQLVLVLADGTAHRANFRFTK